MTAAADQVIDAAASIAANYTGGMWRIPARSATIRLKPGTNLAAATVMAGDAYALTVSDESLTEVVRRHVDKAKLDIAVDEPILQLDGRQGRVDLMMTWALAKVVPDSPSSIRANRSRDCERPTSAAAH